MKSDHRHALLFALEKGIAEPGNTASWRYYNATPIPGLQQDWVNALECEQSFRPEFRKLEAAGYFVKPKLPNSVGHVGSIFILTRSRLWNQYKISQIWNALSVSSTLVIAGNKTDGIGAIRKWLSQSVEISSSISKHHAVVLAARKIDDTQLSADPISNEIEGYQISQGVFSSDGPDAGSRLLVEFFDHRIKGKVADLGAGWGYLSSELLRRSDQVTHLDLFEAEARALAHAEINVARMHGTETSYNWCDVTSEFPKKPYDWVIMNPPFHTGRSAEPALGQRFIEVAASTLPRGGRLLMVANRNLPYEKPLEKHFRKAEKLSERDGFKVLLAVK